MNWPNLNDTGLAVLKAVDAAKAPLSRAAIGKALDKVAARIAEAIESLRAHGYVYDVPRAVQRTSYAPLVGLTEKGERAARGEPPTSGRVSMIRRSVQRAKASQKAVTLSPAAPAPEPAAQVAPASLSRFRGIQHPPIPAPAARPEGMPSVVWYERIRFTSCTSGRAA